jgi:adhesin HecA-like repeat protein
MPTQISKSVGSKGLAASLLAASLPLTWTGFAYANGDNASARLNDFSVRENLRALRLEARQQRIEDRIERRNGTFSVPMPISNNVQDHVRASARTNLPNLERVRGGHRLDSVSTLIERGNTAILFPGQVSTFHTRRPEVAGSTFVNDAGKTRTLTRGLALDFSSTSANITVGNDLLTGSETIDVGGVTKTISAGSKVTAAEFAALNQKLSTGTQTVSLSGGGAAVGGSVDLNSISVDGSTIRASELVVPQNVTVSGDFARSADGVRVTKDVVNFGSIIATSSNAKTNTAIIGARDISNETGASISSQSSETNPTLNLAVRANRDLNNDGTISSAGGLEVSAGRLINNHGLLSATAGDATFCSTNDGVLNVDNRNGTVSAVNGSINIRSADYNGTADSTVYGGDFFSRELNLNAGQATANLTAHDVTGKVNTSGLAAHVSTNTETLVLGQQCLTGDPTYFNTGNIVLGGDISVGEDLAIIAGGNITTNQTSLSISTTDLSGQGHDINIIAGANITSGTTQTPNPLPAQPLGSPTDNATTTVTVDGGSFSGGDIDLTAASTSFSINSSSSSGDLTGGNITIAAFRGTGSLGGLIQLPANSSIFANGSGLGNNGNVTVVTGAFIFPGVQLGTIVNNLGGGVNAGTGVVNIAISQPTTSDGAPISFGTNGSIISGNTIVPSTTLGDAPVFLGPIQTRDLRVSAAASLSVGNVNAESIAITGRGSINLNGSLIASSGIVIVANGGITGSGINIDTGSSTQSGGNVVMVSGATFTQDAGSITITGAGTVASDLNLFGISGFNTESTALGFSGGNVTLVAFERSSGGGGGNVSVGTNIITGGAGLAPNGFVTIIGGGTTSFSVSTGGIKTTGGGAGGTVTLLSATPASVGPISKDTGFYMGTFANESALTGGDISVGGDIRTIANVTVAGNGDVAVSGTINSNFNATGDLSAGSVKLQSGPTGSLSLFSISATGVGQGDGGNINLIGGTGLLTISGTLTSNGGTTGPGGDGGNIFITASQLAAMPVPIVSAQGLGPTGGGGTFSITNTGSGGINLNVGSVNVTGAGDSGSMFFDAGNGTIFKSGGLSLSAKSGQAGFDDGTISLTAATINVSGGFVIFDANSVGTGGNAGTGLVQIVTNGDFTTSGNGFFAFSSGDVFINLNGGQLNTAGAFAGLVNIDAGSNLSVLGTISTTPNGAGNPASGITLKAGTAGGIVVYGLKADGNGAGDGASMFLNAGSGGITAGLVTADSAGGTKGDASLTTTNGDISLTTISVDALQFNLNGGTGGAATVSAGNVNTLGATGTGSLDYNAGSTPLVIGTAGLVGALDIQLTTTNSAVGILNNNLISTAGDVVMNTTKLTNSGTVTAASVIVQSTTNLTVDGGAGGSITGTVPSAGPPGFPSQPAAIQLVTGTGNNLNLSGIMTLTGDVFLSNIGGTTTSNDNSLFTGVNNITLNTLNYVQVDDGTIVANKFIFVGTSIVNATGSVTLTSDAIFHGRDLVIAARDDVNLGNFIIDTSSSTGSGGDVTIIAGFNLDPTTPSGQQLTQAVYQVTGPNVSGGNVTITGAGTVNTSSTAASGDAGNIQVFATGSIALGNLNASSTNGSGGKVDLIGSGVTVGSINTTGSTLDKAVDISSSSASLAPPAVFAAGVLSTGSFFASTDNPGNITVGSINAGKSLVNLFTFDQAVTVQGSLSANSITVNSNTLDFTNVDTLAATVDALGNGGLINLFVDSGVTVNGSTFKVQANGTGTGNGGRITYYTTGDITIGASDDVQFTASAPGSGGSLDLQTEGNITVNANGIVMLGNAGNGAEINLNAGVNDFIGTLTVNDAAFLDAGRAHGAQGNGGRLSLSAQFISVPGTAVADPLVLNASGIGTGNGGEVIYDAFGDETPLFIGAPAKTPKTGQFLEIIAESGLSGGNSGRATVVAGGPLTANMTSLRTRAQSIVGDWDGSNIRLESGTANGKYGSLVITGDIIADAVNNGSAGSVALLSNNKQAFVIGSTKATKNGIQGMISVEATTGNASIFVENNGGGISVASNGATNAAKVVLSAHVKGTIAASKGVTVSAASTLRLVSVSGAIGKKPLLVDAPQLELISTGSSVNVSSAAATQVNLDEGHAAGDFTVTTNGNLFVNNDISTDAGDITLTSNNGLLTVDSHQVTANNGSLTLAALSTTSGGILINDNSVVETQQEGGQVVIAIGAPPKKGSGPNTLSGFTVTPTGKGNAFFGPSTVGVVSGGTVNVLATNKNVLFSNLSTSGGLINVGNNSTIEADPPSRTPGAQPRLETFKLSSMEQANALNSSAPSLEPNAIPSTIPSAIPMMIFDPLQVRTNNAELVTANMGTTDDIGLLAISPGVWQSTNNIGFSSGDGNSDGNSLSNSSEGRLIPGTDARSNTAGALSELSEIHEVFAPSTATVVETAHGTVSLAAGSIAVIVRSEHGLAVYNLHDQGRNNVVVHSNGKRISLSPGRHITVSSHAVDDFASVNAIELVQHRNLEKAKLNNGWNLYSSEFALPSVCYAVKPLKRLMTSTNGAEQKMAKRIMKTTAVLMALNPDRGDFVQYFSPSVTAMQR